MVDTLFQLGTGGVNFPAIKSTLASGVELVVPVWLIAGLRTYVAAVMNSAAAASKNHLLLFNASGSGKMCRIWDIKINANITATVAAASIVINCARTSDKGTAGVSQTIRKSDTNDETLAAQITAVSNPTTPTYTSNELASATLLIEESASDGRGTLFKADSVIAPLVLNEGEGLGIQQGTLAGVGAVNIFIYFTTD